MKKLLIITMLLGVGFSQSTNCDDGLDWTPGWNVLDIVTVANCVLAENCFDLPNGECADINDDGVVNVLDIVLLANCVLAGDCGS